MLERGSRFSANLKHDPRLSNNPRVKTINTFEVNTNTVLSSNGCCIIEYVSRIESISLKLSPSFTDLNNFDPLWSNIVEDPSKYTIPLGFESNSDIWFVT